MATIDNILICTNCPHMGPERPRPLCDINKIWINENAEKHECPKAKFPARGLGDVIEKITTVTGIKAVVEKVEKVTGKGCGCNERKETLNNAVPLNKAHY